MCRGIIALAKDSHNWNLMAGPETLRCRLGKGIRKDWGENEKRDWHCLCPASHA